MNNDRIEKAKQDLIEAEKRLEQKKNRLKMLENSASQKEKEKERKLDERRKYLLGAMYLPLWKNDAVFRQKLLVKLDAQLIKDSERVLLGLKEKSKKDELKAPVEDEAGTM